MKKYKVFGEIEFRVYVELGESKNKLGAWMIKRKYKKMHFESIFTATKPEAAAMIGKIYKV